MKKSKTININGVKVEIKKIPIGKFAELMMAVDKLPSIVTNAVSLDELENINAQLLFSKLPSILANAQNELFKLVSVASGIVVEDISEVDIEEFIDIILAVLEINNIQGIVNKVKNFKKVLQEKVK